MRRAAALHQLQFGPVRARVKLRDVAAAAGVSESAASRALGGYPDVAAATRERVERVAREMGYRASSRARSLALGRHAPRRCALVIFGGSTATFSRSFFAGHLLFGIMEGAHHEGLDVQVLSLPQREGAAAGLARLVAEDRADGYVVLGPGEIEPQDVAPLQGAGVPFVLVNRHFDHSRGAGAAGDRHPVLCATIDYLGATRSTVERLSALGHRRIVALLPEGRTSTLLDHVQGWREGVRRAGLEGDDVRLLRYSGTHVPAADRLATEALVAPAPATAFVCFNDICASGVLRAALRLGRAVPQALSVVGFDNILAPYSSPPLCSYDGHVHEVGSAAVRLLGTALRDGPDAVPPHARRVTLAPTFVCRDSCGPPHRPGVPAGPVAPPLDARATMEAGEVPADERVRRRRPRRP